MPLQWDKAAELRRRQIEDRVDITFNDVFVPYYERLVSSMKPRSMLEVGCGTGHLAARLACLVPTVHAIEPLGDMYRTAIDVLRETRVDVRQARVQDYRPGRDFDLVLAHLCIQMVDDPDSFVTSSASLLSHGGVLVISIPHPCFWNSYTAFIAPNTYQYMTETSVEAKLTITRDRGNEMIVPFHHRPISTYVKLLRNARLCICDLDEIYPPKNVQMKYGKQWDYPRYLIIAAEKHN